MVTDSPVSAEASRTTPLQQGPSMCAAMFLEERPRVVVITEMCSTVLVARRAVTRAEWVSAQSAKAAVTLDTSGARR